MKSKDLNIPALKSYRAMYLFGELQVLLTYYTGIKWYSGDDAAEVAGIFNDLSGKYLIPTSPRLGE